MKTKLTDKKRKILRKIYGALSFTTALFVFQACYGTPQDFGMEVSIRGYVKSRTTDNSIPGIKVTVNNEPQYEVTGNTGIFAIGASPASEYKLKFEDIDSVKNGTYLPKDTILKTVTGTTWITVYLNDK
jgi:hypothetical protein